MQGQGLREASQPDQPARDELHYGGPAPDEDGLTGINFQKGMEHRILRQDVMVGTRSSEM